MLEGKKPLPVPPPKAFAYPQHQLVEEPGPHKLLSVWYDEKYKAEGIERPIVIDQAIWSIVAKDGDEYVVRWPHSDGNPLFRVYQKDNVHVSISKQKDGTFGPNYGRAWVMEKVDE
jgi:hypothetical protein